jgi:hypothetical protein
MEDGDIEVTIIEATEEAQNKYGWMDGSDLVILKNEHMEALKNGKCLAWNDGEYVTFVVME